MVVETNSPIAGMAHRTECKSSDLFTEELLSIFIAVYYNTIVIMLLTLNTSTACRLDKTFIEIELSTYVMIHIMQL